MFLVNSEKYHLSRNEYISSYVQNNTHNVWFKTCTTRYIAVIGAQNNEVKIV